MTQAGRGSCSSLGTDMYHGEDGAAVGACYEGQRPQAEGAGKGPRGEVWPPARPSGADGREMDHQRLIALSEPQRAA